MTLDSYLVPVRKMHDDGYITVRYLNADGTEPDDLPEEYTLGATLDVGTEIWDYDRYQLLHRMPSNPYVPHEITNLLHLSNTNPLLFEEVLVYLETEHGVGRKFFKRVLRNKKMVPTERNPEVTYHDMYSALMLHSDLLMELGKGYAVGMEANCANMMFNDARKTMDGFDHPLFAAAAVAAWIIHRGTGKRSKIKYADHVDDIKYIDSKLEEIVLQRNDLVRVGSIRREDIESTLNCNRLLREGTL